MKSLTPLTRLRQRCGAEPYERGRRDGFPPLAAGSARSALALADLVVAYALRGLLRGLWRGGARRRRDRRAAGAGAVGLRRRARAAASDDDFAIRATSEFHLAYIRTGVPEVDDAARAGLTGLADVLNRRTAVEAAEPMEVDVEQDELVFFPLLYWPVVDGEPLPSAKAIAALNRYLATGGTILFDTRDQGERTPVQRRRDAAAPAAARRRARRAAAGCRCRPTTSSPSRST